MLGAEVPRYMRLQKEQRQGAMQWQVSGNVQSHG